MRNLPKDPPSGELQPDHALGGVEHICELRKSCIVLYGIFSEIVRMVYADTDGRLVGTPDVVWKQGGTDIWIDSELRWEDQHPEVRPAIYVQLGQMQYQSYFPGLNGKILGADRFGSRSYEQRASGTVTFMHVASTSGEACALADNTEYALKTLQDPICRDFCFTRFESIGRQALDKLPKEATDKYASAVTFEYEFADAWAVKEECPVLKSIDILDAINRPICSHGGTFYDRQAGHVTVNRDNIITENKGTGPAGS